MYLVFLKSKSYTIDEVKEEAGGFRVIAKSSTEAVSNNTESEEDMSVYSCEINPSGIQDKQLVFITSDKIGHGDDELGRKLMANFIKTLLRWEILCGGLFF